MSFKLVHDEYGEATADSQREVNRLAQYGWKVAPEKPSRKRSKPVEEPVEVAPEFPEVTE